MACDVQVFGAGVIGLAIATELAAAGVDVRVVDPRGARWSAAARSAVVLPCHPEHPHRFLAALGEERGRELVAFAARSLAALPGFSPVGVDWACPGPEAADVAPSLAACAALGLPASPAGAPGSPRPGFTLPTGGVVDLAALRAALARPVHAEPDDADVDILATGAPRPGRGGWLRDKLLPVRWHAVRWARPRDAGGAPVLLPVRPVVSRHASVYAVADRGGLTLAGARWAEPHLGVGDAHRCPLSPAVLDKLTALAAQDFGVASPPDERCAVITWESCDGLPLVGPLPGTPRELACTGFGAATLPYGLAAARALVDGLLGRAGPALPAPLALGRLQ